MKKKISLLLCVLLVSLCFIGCSDSADETTPDTETMENVVKVVISTFSEMTEEQATQFKTTSEDQLNYVMWSNGLPIKGEDFITMIKAWESAEDECGEYISHGDYEVEVKGDEVVLSTLAQYEEREATISFSFDEDSNLESMDVSAKYSMGEILKKAGLNTVLGMGTVFAVLIFLAFLIYLMKYIPVVMGLFNKKEKTNAEEVKPVVVENITEAAAATETVDDLELIAVITAAIAAQEGTTTDGFVVRSIRRRPSNNWI